MPSPFASNIRRRQNSHLTSTLFQTPLSRFERSDDDIGIAGEVFKYEWPIYGLSELREHVEDSPGSIWTVELEMADQEALPAALRTGKVIGPGWFKLDIGGSTGYLVAYEYMDC
jgi:hypothetical protein